MFELRRLGDAIAKQLGGGTPSRQISSYWNGPIPWASVKDFVNGDDALLSTQESISLAGLRASASNIIPAGTPLVCTRMAVGRSAMAPMPIAINQDVKALSPTRGTSSAYLLRLLQYARPRAEAVAVGSTVKGIRIHDYLAIAIPIAPSVEQVHIAVILDTLDITIRQTEAVIEKLKQVKQGLLHDLLTRGIDTNGELRPPQSQAPHLYKDSPLGWIPKEWISGLLYQWLEFRPKNGYSPRPAASWTGIQMLGLSCLTGTGFQPRQLKDAPANDPLLLPALLKSGDLLMSRANTRELVGLVGIYRDVGTACYYPDLMMRLTPIAGASVTFLEVVLSSPGVRRQVQALASGTSSSMVKISSQIVMALKISMPAIDEQRRILALLDAADQHLTIEKKLVDQLCALKSGLMDDLLTGRVRVTPLMNTAAICA